MKRKKKLLKSSRTKSGLTKLLNQSQITKPIKKLNKNKIKQTSGRPNRSLKQTMAPQLDSMSFRKLQKSWYDKLQADGFKDIETLNMSYGITDYLNSNAGQNGQRLAMAYNTETETYFRRLTNYITHNPNWANDKIYHAIGAMYIVGTSYRKIVAALALKGQRTNIWRVHHVVKLLATKATTWNKVHPEGLDFEPDIATLYKIKST